MFHKLNSFRVLSLLIILIILGVSSVPVGSRQVGIEGAETEESESEIIYPDAESEFAEVPPLSAAQQAALYEKMLATREKQDALADNHVGEETDYLGDAYPYAERTSIATPPRATELYFGTPSDFVIGRNMPNTRANNGSNSTLAEPAAANDGAYVFYGGNWHFEYSTDRGATWTNVAIPAGPAEAPYGCCDPDVVYDRARGLTIWSYLYTNADLTNGVVRIYVRRNMNAANTCSYTIDPAGTANNLVPDYPHLGLSNDYLYLTMNNTGTGTQSAQVRRYSLTEMGNCVGTPNNTYTYGWTYGQRVFVPVEGARETMYWGAMIDSDTFRIYSWPESTTVVSSVDRSVSVSNFTNPDCRGGTGNFDFIERSTSYSITGFRMRGAVGPNGLLFLWNVGTDASHPQGHVHAALFRESDLSLIGQPHIWSSSYCFGYPALSVNDRGDYGLSIASGGKSGGGGLAARGFVGIDDDFTSGVGVWGTVYGVAAGTHNRSDGRFGDYFTVRRLSPCGNWFVATSYALNGGTAATNVNARYAEFGRRRDYACWYGWTTRTRIPLPP